MPKLGALALISIVTTCTMSAPTIGLTAEPGLFNADGYRAQRYRRPVPEQPPAGRRIETEALRDLIGTGRPVLVDVLAIAMRPEAAEFGIVFLPSEVRYNIPGSHWLPNVGHGSLDARMERYFTAHLHRITGGNRNRPLVFYCVTDCWMSWNAVKRAHALGYSKLFWYPEGTDGWAESGLPLAPAQPESLSPGALGAEIGGDEPLLQPDAPFP